MCVCFLYSEGGALCGSPQLALCSPICLPPSGDLRSAGACSAGRWMAPLLGLEGEQSGVPLHAIPGAGPSAPSTNLIRK